MQPDLHRAMRDALIFGPGYCPPDLFAGDIVAIVGGLQSHAATIAQARHSVLENIFPRTRSLIGQSAFQELCSAYIEGEAVRRLPLEFLGRDFPALLEGKPRFLANIELSWLETYRAADAPILELGDLAGLSPSEIAGMTIALHPAARIVRGPDVPAIPLVFDDVVVDSDIVLVTRPYREVQLHPCPSGAGAFAAEATSPTSIGELIEIDQHSFNLFLAAGALCRSDGNRQ